MTKICHLTSVHYWQDNRIFFKECVSLAANGFEVTLIAFSDKASTNTIDGVTVKLLNFDRHNRVGRLLNGKNLIYQEAINLNAEIYHIHDPELISVAKKLKNKNNKIVIYDAHEDVPMQILYKSWLGPLFIRKIISKIYDSYEKKSIKKLDGLISVIDEITSKFNNKNKVTIKNYPNTSALKLIDKNRVIKKKQIIYVGDITYQRGALEYVKMMEFLPSDYTLVLIGKCDDTELLKELKSNSNWDKVKFLGFIPINDVYIQLLESKIGLCVLHPEKNYLTSLPTKGFEYMAAQLPLVISDFEYWNPFFKDCGIMVKPKSPKLIADAINLLINDEKLYAEKVSNCYKLSDQYSWSNEEKKLINLYNTLLNQNNE